MKIRKMMGRRSRGHETQISILTSGFNLPVLIRAFSRRLLLGAGIIAALNLLHAQETATPVQTGAATVASESDLEVMLQAVESVPPMPADSLPEAATYWSAQHYPGSEEPWPPLPISLGMGAWSLGNDGVYLLDDLNHVYASPKQSKGAATTSSGAMMTMDNVDLNPGDGGTNDGGYNPEWRGTPVDTNGLWLQIFSVSNGVAYLALNHATDEVYEVMSRTNLISPGWQTEAGLFPANGTVQTNALPFTVPELDRTNALFFRAMDWTGVTHGGNTAPDWWFYYFYGTTNLSDTNLDSQGDTLRYDYQNGLDPNVIQFSLQFTNDTISASPAYGSVAISGGTPFYEAILLNDTNTADAVWQPYTSTNVVVPLNWGNGLYTVTVGLRGLPTNAMQTWLQTQLNLNNLAPVLTITNPTASTVSTPLIQLQGLVSASLSSLTYDVSNAAGIITNQTGYWNLVFYDTNLLTFTTNDFQCYDIALTNGLNTITLHATDLAGNTTTKNVSYTLNYSGDHTAPVLSIVWPQNGTQISGSNFTLQAQMDDATATVTASIVDTNGDTNIVQGLVERNGKVWLDDVPLSIGTNILTVTATDGADNSTTNNLTLVQSGALVTMDPLSSGQFNQSSVNVTGTINDTNSTYDIYVNGVEAYYTDGLGDWEADGVPVSATGTATFDVEIYVGDPVDVGSQIISMAQATQVVIASYQNSFIGNNNFPGSCGGSGPTVFSDETEHWVSGDGSDHRHFTSWDGECSDPVNLLDDTEDLSSYTNNLPVTWENVSESEGDDYGTTMTSIKTTVEIVPSGQQGIGQSALYLVMAQVMDEDTGLQLAASAVQFMNQLAGTTTVDVTNSDGSVWSEGLVAAPTDAQVEVTPIAAGNVNFSQMKLSLARIIYYSVNPNNVPTTFDTNAVQTTLQSQLAVTVFTNLQAGQSVQIKVHVEANLPTSLGWHGNPKYYYVNRVNFGWGNVPYNEFANNNGHGDIEINLNPIVGVNILTQGWVNYFAHEGVWGNVAAKDDDDSQGDDDIASGHQSYTIPFTATSHSRLIILNACGLNSN